MRADIDGFTIIPGFGGYPFDYNTAALRALTAIRNSSTYRPFWIRLPEEESSTLAAYQTYEYQVHLKPGSWWCGLHISVWDNITLQPIRPQNTLSLQITESYTGLETFSEFSDSTALFRTLLTGEHDLGLHLLPEPRIIVAPGDLDVELCNLTGDTVRWQLALFTAEPYDVVES